MNMQGNCVIYLEVDEVPLDMNIPDQNYLAIYVYYGTAYLYKALDGQYIVPIGNEEFSTFSLAEAEQYLWDNWLVDFIEEPSNV